MPLNSVSQEEQKCFDKCQEELTPVFLKTLKALHKLGSDVDTARCFLTANVVPIAVYCATIKLALGPPPKKRKKK